MKKIKSLFILILNLSLIPIMAYPALGQDQTGSISGTVFRDANDNGLCADEGEERLGNIPLEIINDDSGDFFTYTTEPDGSFTHTTAILGFWQVTVVPGTNWRITSQQTINVELTADEPDVSSINFCIIEVQPQQDDPPVTLPESGAFIAPPLLYAGALGLLFVILGLIILLARRFVTSDSW